VRIRQYLLQSCLFRRLYLNVHPLGRAWTRLLVTGDVPMARADWAIAASAYEELRPLDAPAFAYEFHLPQS